MTVDFGRPTTQLRCPGVALRLDLRTVAVCTALAAGAILVGLAGLSRGDFQIPVGGVVAALLGRTDETDAMVQTIVVQWRLPRVSMAVGFGAALGVSGAIFQSVTRNPLGSPDVIGFSAGSYTGALTVIILIGGSYVHVATGALIGGIGTAGLVYVLAYRRGVQGFSLIIVGIGVAAMLTSFNTWLILTAELEVAMSAAVWGAGSLNGIGWEHALPATCALALLTPVVAGLVRSMRQLELGDDAARAHGLNIETARLGLVVGGVALTAVVTATAGPIAFVALAAPQIARRLTRTPGVALVPAAFMGAFLLTSADYLAQHALPATLPVGVVTVAIGGTYLVWLLVREARRRS